MTNVITVPQRFIFTKLIDLLKNPEKSTVNCVYSRKLRCFINYLENQKTMGLFPLDGAHGVRRNVKTRVGFLGDSITQGIGTDLDSYEHWCHKAAQALGPEYACWNLGIGCGRASDAATGGIWLQKALQNDCIVVCFGVNDIIQGDGPQLHQNLDTIVTTLKNNGKKVILQSVPPFDFLKQPRIDLWEAQNRHIRQVLAAKCDAFLDVSAFLSVDGAGQTTKFGGHPNAEGCSVWAEHLLPVLRSVLQGCV